MICLHFLKINFVLYLTSEVVRNNVFEMIDSCFGYMPCKDKRDERNRKSLSKRQLRLWIFLDYVFKASTGILFKSAEKFSGRLRVLIHCLMPTFHEHCSLFHQGE